MAGFQEHEEKVIPVFQALKETKRTTIGKHTKSIDTEVQGRKDDGASEIRRATEFRHK